MKLSQGRIVPPAFVRLAVLGLSLVAALPAAAQEIFVTGFEPLEGYQGSPDGVVVTGQQGWYVPVAGSTDQNIYTYDGNALGLPPNAPLGLFQFLGAQLTDEAFPRAQHNVDFGNGVFAASYDIAAGFTGCPTAAMDNIGSFSLQPSDTARYFIAVNFWVPGLEGSKWTAGYNAFDATGAPYPDNLIPGPEWTNLDVYHWYHQITLFDFITNRIVLVTITDLTTLETHEVAPTDWYLAGGAGGRGLPLPTAVRFFVGGGAPGAFAPGNLQGWDNLLIAGVPDVPGGREPAQPLSMPSAGAATQ
jgi:hypothetical protein